MNSIFTADWPIPALMTHIWNGCVQGTLALLLVLVVCRLFPKLAPSTSDWPWRVGFLKALIAFAWIGSICLPVMNHSYIKPASTVDQVGITAEVYIHSVAASAVHATDAQYIVLLLGLAWGVGFALFGLRMRAASRRTRELRRSCSSVENGELLDDLTDLCRRMEIRRIPQLITGNVNSPLLCGFVSPCIILPERIMDDCSREEVRLILAHELAHVKRCDVLWAWLPMLAQWVFFFNPVVWLVRKEWLFAREASCDLLAIDATSASQVDYGKMLLSHASQAGMSRPLIMAGIGEPYEMLKRRLMAMMASEAGAMRQNKSALVISISILSVAILAIGLIRFYSNADSPLYMDRMQNVFASLQAGNYQNAERDFWPLWKTAMPPQKLGQAWATGVAKIGPFNGFTITRTEEGHGAVKTHIIYINCKFQKQAIPGAFVFDERQKRIIMLIISDTPHEVQREVQENVRMVR